MNDRTSKEGVDKEREKEGCDDNLKHQVLGRECVVFGKKHRCCNRDEPFRRHEGKIPYGFPPIGSFDKAC